MSDSPENMQVSTAMIMDFFLLKANEKAESSPAYLKALANFRAFTEAERNVADTFSETALNDWCVSMYAAGLSDKTRLLYLNSISALYTLAVKEHLISPTDAFRNVKALLRTEDGGWMDKTALDRVMAMTRSGSSRSLAADMALFSLLSGCMPPADVALLRKSDLEGLSDECRVIALRHISPRRSYIFDLEQPKLTTRQMERKLEAMFRTLAATENLSRHGDARETIESWWAYAALRKGVRWSTITTLLGRAPEGIPAQALSTQVELTPEEKKEIIGLVGGAFVSNPLKWYAMRLRPRVNFEELTERLKVTEEIADKPELFYPLDVITRRIGKKLVFKRQPVIKNIVFFHCRVTEIAPLFRYISDLAWCYTVTGKSGSAYAAIPERAFREFQEAIGHYTAQYEAEISAADNPAKGAGIKVTSGLFRGLESSLDKIETENGENIFRLLHTGTNGFSWNIGVSPRHAKVCATPRAGTGIKRP